MDFMLGRADHTKSYVLGSRSFSSFSLFVSDYKKTEI